MPAAQPSSTPPSSFFPRPPGACGPGRAFGGGARCGRRQRGHGNHGVFLGLVVVAWGGLLLAREFGLVDPSLHATAFWPLVLIAFGVSALVRRWSLPSALVGLAVALLGCALLAERLGWAVGAVSHLWPLLVVAAGLGILWRGLQRRRAPRPRDGVEQESVSADELRRRVTMGGLALAVDSRQFRGGTLEASMSGVQLDLRRAELAAEEIRLELSIFMSGVELQVPAHWRVVNEISPFMGAVEDKTELRPDASGVQRRLVLRGSLSMGALEIKN